jgi:hypothetical protein
LYASFSLSQKLYYTSSITPTFAPTSNYQSSNNNYLTNILSTSFSLSQKLYYTSTFAPTNAPTTIITFIPTVKPTIIETPVIIFDTKLTFDNYNDVELDRNSQAVVVIATANSMNVSASYVEYIGSAIARRRLTMFRILGYNLVVTLKTTMPLQGNSDSLYTLLTTNLINSVNSGLFTTYLLSTSNNLGVTSFENSSIASVQNGAYIIQEPDTKDDVKPHYNNNSMYNTIYIVFSVLLFIYAILYFVWLRRKYRNNTQRLDDIRIRIVEEQTLVNFAGEKIKLRIIN